MHEYYLILLQSFFLIMIRRPPRSTLFPYTTPSDLQRLLSAGGIHRGDVNERLEQRARLATRLNRAIELRLRSEEHTSELQSHSDLVCRLLLEKKKESELRFVSFAK